MPVLQIQELTKRYGAITAVNKLSLEVEKGNIYGILGPNGSGKTTTLGIILGIINRDEGDYQWFDGKYGKNSRRKVGALLETPNFYPYLTAARNLEIVAHIKKVDNSQNNELLELVNLVHRKDHAFRTFSFGMKQRLAIAAAMIGDPEVLIFDEPTNGLDPEGIAEVRNTLIKIAKRGKTIIMASHILDEVEKICSHVAIIKNGHLLATGTVGAIINNQITVELSSNDNDKLIQLLRNRFNIDQVDTANQKIFIQVDEDVSTGMINQLAFDNGIVLNHIIAKAKSLESEFLEITQGKKVS